ncbi:unnamed protein product, partial [Tenebrio molitor]
VICRCGPAGSPLAYPLSHGDAAPSPGPPRSGPRHRCGNMCSDRSPSEIRPFRGLIGARNENYKLPESLLTRRSNYL